MNPRSVLGAAAASLMLVATPASAVPVLWELLDSNFDDGTLLAGSFVYDADTNTYSDWNISVEASSFLSAYTYDSSAPGNFAGSPSATMIDFVAFPDSAPSRYLRLSFATALTNSATFADVLHTGESFECDNCTNIRYVSNAQVFAVPEPGTWAMMAGGLFALGAWRRRKQH